MIFQITCSNCGRNSMRQGYDAVKTPEKIIKAGWRSYGDAFYCPRCVKTWKERNGEDRKLASIPFTRDRIQRKMIEELKRYIRYQNTGEWD